MQYQFGIAVLIQNNIFRLDVSIDDTSTVKKGQGLDNTSRVKPGAAFVQTSSETTWRRAGLSIAANKTTV